MIATPKVCEYPLINRHQGREGQRQWNRREDPFKTHEVK